MLLTSTQDISYVVNLDKIFSGSSHLFPGFVEQNYTDAVELFKGAVMSEKHGVVVLTLLTGRLSDVEYLAEQLHELDTGTSKRALVLIRAARVL